MDGERGREGWMRGRRKKVMEGVKGEKEGERERERVR